MNQTKLESFIEACINTLIGLCITMTFLPFVNYLCNVKMTIKQVSLHTLLMTILSVSRGYVIRRFFNNLSYIKIKVLQWIKNK